MASVDPTNGTNEFLSCSLGSDEISCVNEYDDTYEAMYLGGFVTTDGSIFSRNPKYPYSDTDVENYEVCVFEKDIYSDWKYMNCKIINIEITTD